MPLEFYLSNDQQFTGRRKQLYLHCDETFFKHFKFFIKNKFSIDEPKKTSSLSLTNFCFYFFLAIFARLPSVVKHFYVMRKSTVVF